MTNQVCDLQTDRDPSQCGCLGPASTILRDLVIRIVLAPFPNYLHCQLTFIPKKDVGWSFDESVESVINHNFYPQQMDYLVNGIAVPTKLQLVGWVVHLYQILLYLKINKSKLVPMYKFTINKCVRLLQLGQLENKIKLDCSSHGDIHCKNNKTLFASTSWTFSN